ncbi:MAG: hypothetical protein IIA87_05735 [Nanoarchaeota archaeon]|nr:hypothetical protein [Nanoarchaeota archaeon]
MKQKYELRNIFLREFVRELIVNTKPASVPEASEELPEKEKLIETKTIESMPISLTKTIPKQKPETLTLTKPTRKPMVKEVEIRSMQISPKPTSGFESFPIPKRGAPIVLPESGNINLGKLNLLLSDSRVQSVECTGPNKTILAKKNGVIQTTKISLKDEEIEKIINDFSQRTRIPLVNGMLKAALGNLIMTAVTSDFVGSRFVIQKKNPFQPAMF